MKWIVLSVAALFAMSCSNDSKWNEAPTADVKVNISAAEMSGGAGYKRDEAPTYVKSVTLSAYNAVYAKSVAATTFEFGTPGTEDIVLTGLTVGGNEITAVGNTFGTAYEGELDVNSATGISSDVLNTRAGEYATYMAAQKPLFAEYNGSVNKNIVVGAGNSTEIAMDADNHRVAIVLENKSANHNVIVRVYEVGNTTPIKTFGTEADPIVNGEQVAYIINDALAIGDISYKVEVDYYTTDGVKVETLAPAQIVASKLKNITKLYSFERETLLTGSITTTFTWTKFTDVSTGEEL